MTRSGCFGTLALCVGLSAGAAEAPGTSRADLAARFAADVHVLASDEMQGRGLDTAGIGKAASWLEARLRKLGLDPAFGRSYRQPFPVKVGVEARPGNALSDVADGDWTPLGMSTSGAFEGELVFVGYGLRAPTIGYDDFEGVDLKGKIALMLRYEPQERDAASPFDGRRPSRWSAVRYKIHQARERGAVAVIFASGPVQDEGKDKLPALKNDGPESPAGLPVLQVRTSVAQRLAGVDLGAFQAEVDRDLRPRSRATGRRLSGRVALEARSVQAENLAGWLPGRGALASEVVVVGAHYDHLGFGGDHSMRPNERAIHNGADDNASGSVAVLLAAQRASELLRDAGSRRSVLFALFSGEEVGLAGSAAFVAAPPVPIERVVAMLNLDMVGRLRDQRLAALGTESAPEWGDAVRALGTELGLEIAAGGDGYGPSDQTSFYAARVPVVHFFTGAHDAYHTPDDDAATLNAPGGALVAELTARLAARVALGALTPHYARAVTAPAQSGDSRGYGAWLGTVPDYRAMSDEGGGVLLADVRAGGPADKAGLRGGDRLVEMGGTRIDTLYDMTFALQDHKPGDTLDVVVLRGGAPVTLRATLGSRSETGRAPAAEQPKPAASPAAPAPQPSPTAPVDPHAAAPAPAQDAKPGLVGAEFYAGRPGRDFVVRAGKPFAQTVEGERHLRDVRQLTFGGENAEAYFRPDGRQLIYQWTRPEGGCDQQYVIELDSDAPARLVSTGRGRTTCGYYDWPEDDRIVYASTEAASPECPPVPDRSQGYVWPVYDSYDLWQAAPDGSGAQRLTNSPGYDAEATWCHRGGKLVFTSARDGDLDLYEMDEAGQVKRLTRTPGYDGGAFYSPDCSEIVFRGFHPEGEALADFRRLLGQGLVRPTVMELFVMNADGSNVRQITHTGKANFGPYFHPDGKRVIYSSNAGPGGGQTARRGAAPEFDLLLIAKDGGEPERVTFAPGFDGFPMWSPDGEFLVFASNRADPQGRQTNLFIARWVE